MKCNKTEKDIINYLYGEMSSEETEEFEKHLAECAECKAELSELKHSRELLQQISDAMPGMNLFRPRKPWWKEPFRLLPAGRAGRIGLGVAAALAALLVIGSLARLQIHYGNSSFDIKMGGVSSANTLSPIQEQQIVSKIERQNYQVLNTWLQNFQDQQNKEFKQVLYDYSYALQNRQDQQFLVLGKELQQFYNHTDQRFRQTDLVLNNLIQTNQYSQ